MEPATWISLGALALSAGALILSWRGYDLSKSTAERVAHKERPLLEWVQGSSRKSGSSTHAGKQYFSMSGKIVNAGLTTVKIEKVRMDVILGDDTITSEELAGHAGKPLSPQGTRKLSQTFDNLEPMQKMPTVAVFVQIEGQEGWIQLP